MCQGGISVKKSIALVCLVVLLMQCMTLEASAGIISSVPYGQTPVTVAVPVAQPVNTGSAPQQTANQPTSRAVTAVGASVQYATGSGRATGEKYASVPVNGDTNVYITADVPRGKKLAYWVINGVRYDFNRVPKKFSIRHVTEALTIEAVYTSSTTLLSPEKIQEGRTGAQLWVRTIHAKLCHITARDKGAGGWMKEFNFTDDYKNLATGQRELGGQVTARVQAVIPKNKKISYWKFNNMEIDFDTNVTEFIVRTLNVSMVYEPIFASVKQKEKTPDPVPDPDPQPVYYNVTCTNCSFSGGGYSKARSGKVLAGTRITVQSDFSYVEEWTVNGSTVYIRRTPKKGVPSIEPNQRSSISVTVNNDKNIVCRMQIN